MKNFTIKGIKQDHNGCLQVLFTKKVEDDCYTFTLFFGGRDENRQEEAVAIKYSYTPLHNTDEFNREKMKQFYREMKVVGMDKIYKECQKRLWEKATQTVFNEIENVYETEQPFIL